MGLQLGCSPGALDGLVKSGPGATVVGGPEIAILFPRAYLLFP